MPWDEAEWDRELLAFTRGLIQMRTRHHVLSNGTFRPLTADNRSRTIVFERRDRTSRAVVALNDGYRAHSVHAEDFSVHLGPGEWVIEIEEKGTPKMRYESGSELRF
jgi:pullulanase/glycogen debranching enzyme